MHENQLSKESERESELASVVGRYDLAKSDAKAMPGNVTELPKALSDRLNKLGQLPENWDSYGAPAISQRTIDRAASTLREILAIGKNNIPLPLIAPAGDGTIVMEWKTEWGKELILDIPTDDSPSGFLLVEPTVSGGELEIEEAIGEQWQLEQVIRRLAAR